MLKTNNGEVTGKTAKGETKKTKVEKKIKVSLDQMDTMQAGELLASRVTCQRRS